MIQSKNNIGSSYIVKRFLFCVTWDYADGLYQSVLCWV